MIREQTSETKRPSEIDSRIENGIPETVEYAGFWIRFGAYIVDLLGMVAGALIVGFYLGYLFGEEFINALPNVFWNYSSYVIYSTLTLTIWSTTFGKYMYGLKVRTGTNEDLDFNRALKRSLLQPLSTLFFCARYWGMGKDAKSRAWHDKKAKTVVIREKKNLVPAYILTAVAAVTWLYLSALSAGF